MDAQCNFSAIGNKDFVKHKRWPVFVGGR